MGCLSACVFAGACGVLLAAIGLGTLRASFPRRFVSDSCSNLVSPGAAALGVLPFQCGWREVRPGIHAFVQPNGSWCWSNAGFVGQSGLLVDTLTDPLLTRGMLRDAPGPVAAVIYTHPDVDHIMGDQEVAREVPRHGRAEVQSEMQLLPKQAGPLIHALTLAHYLWGVAEYIGWQSLVDTPVWPVARKVLGWARIQARMSVISFHEMDEKKLVGVTHPFNTSTVSLPGAEVHHMGSIHSKSDSVVLVHSSRVCFAGDLLFIGIAPVMWAGPAKSWVAALDRLLELTDNDWLFVPGHGPVTDVKGVRFMRRYFAYLDEAVASCPAEQDDGECAEQVLKGLPKDLVTEEPQRILVSARVERIARRTGTSAKIDLMTKVSFLTEQGEKMLV